MKQDSILKMWKYRGTLYARSPDEAAVRHGIYNSNLLVRAVWRAWNEEYPLRINVNSIWLTILHEVGIYVSLHPDQLREKFVRHDGTMNLEVEIPPFDDPSQVDWTFLFGELADLVEKNSRPGVRDGLRVDFSNSSPVDVICGDIALMDVVNPYFKYGMVSSCGIPWIELLGSPEDWTRLREKVAFLRRFVLKDDVDSFGAWVKNLEKVVKKFVDAANGKPDVAFFRKVASLEEQSGTDGGVTGWILDFFLYDKEHRQAWGLSDDTLQRRDKEWRETDDYAKEKQGRDIGWFPSGVSKVPITLRRLDRGVVETLELYGGLMTMIQHDDMSLEPCSGWGLVMTGSQPIQE